jgi:hypothetical protein
MRSLPSWRAILMFIRRWARGLRIKRFPIPPAVATARVAYERAAQSHRPTKAALKRLQAARHAALMLELGR